MDNLEKVFKEYVQEALVASLNFARSKWISEAQQGLKSTREAYLEGLNTIKVTAYNKGYIELTGKFPNMIETGYSSYDMKTGFSDSPKKIAKKGGGWYLTIPFRHSTNSKISQNMPKDIFKEAKKLNPGEKLTEALVSNLGYDKQTSWAGYRWKNSQYDNLVRIVKTYDSGKTRGRYMTFRRVSDKSDPSSWMHPGYAGLKALDRVQPETDKFLYDYFRG